MSVRLLFVRERTIDRGHGDVHLVAWASGKQKPTTTMCGRTWADMRKNGTPFRGWNEVLCATCSAGLEH